MVEGRFNRRLTNQLAKPRSVKKPAQSGLFYCWGRFTPAWTIGFGVIQERVLPDMFTETAGIGYSLALVRVCHLGNDSLSATLNGSERFRVKPPLQELPTTADRL